MTETGFSDTERQSVQSIIAALTNERIPQGIQELRQLKDNIYAAIPQKQRQGRGITWVVQRIADIFNVICANEEQLKILGLILYQNLETSDLLMGVPIFIMAQYGQRHPTEVFSFFAEIAASPDWIVREFAAGGFHSIIASNKEIVLPWLKEIAQSKNPNVRRFARETLRPVTVNRWMAKEPEYSLSVLRLLFREAHPYPRTSVGNNLSDLSSRQPELIFSIVQELVASKDPNSYWIAYRACRNLVKKFPRRVMDILGVDEYHYKDRNFYRSNLIDEG